MTFNSDHGGDITRVFLRFLKPVKRTKFNKTPYFVDVLKNT